MTIKKVEELTGLYRSVIRFYEKEDLIYPKRNEINGYREIPVQWNDGIPSTLVNRWFIFSFPVACVLIKYLLRPFICRWYENLFVRNDAIVDYITNSCCFVALAIELFIVYSSISEAPHIEVILITVAMILFGLLIKINLKMNKQSRGC